MVVVIITGQSKQLYLSIVSLYEDAECQTQVSRTGTSNYIPQILWKLPPFRLDSCFWHSFSNLCRRVRTVRNIIKTSMWYNEIRIQFVQNLLSLDLISSWLIFQLNWNFTPVKLLITHTTANKEAFVRDVVGRICLDGIQLHQTIHRFL